MSPHSYPRERLLLKSGPSGPGGLREEIRRDLVEVLGPGDKGSPWLSRPE